MNTPLSAEETLCRLEMLAVETRCAMLGCLDRAAKWAKADLERYPRAGFNAANNEDMALRYERDGAVLEQAVAVLEVLTHPNFANLSHFYRTPELLGWPVMVGFNPGTISPEPSYATGATVLEALLAAHKALKEKEATPDGQTTGDPQPAR